MSSSCTPESCTTTSVITNLNNITTYVPGSRRRRFARVGRATMRVIRVRLFTTTNTPTCNYRKPPSASFRLSKRSRVTCYYVVLHLTRITWRAHDAQSVCVPTKENVWADKFITLGLIKRYTRFSRTKFVSIPRVTVVIIVSQVRMCDYCLCKGSGCNALGKDIEKSHDEIFFLNKLTLNY